jgi:cupin 2 domain-containing protein
MVAVHNLFRDLPSGQGEAFEEILRKGGVRIERIVSRGQASPPGFWYDQGWDEWVLLVRGSALLGFADGATVSLGPGDHLLIPARCRHRVESTDPSGETVWLAVHLEAEAGGG